MDEFSDGYAIFTTKPAPPAGLAARLREYMGSGDRLTNEAADALDARDARVAEMEAAYKALGKENAALATEVTRLTRERDKWIGRAQGSRNTTNALLTRAETAERERDEARDALLLLQAGERT